MPSKGLTRLIAWPKLRGLLAYGLGPALGLLSGPILARSLGAEGRGQFSSVMEPLTLAGALATIGLPSAVTYFIAAGNNPRSVLVKAFVVGVPTALGTYALLTWYSTAVSQSQGIPRWWLLVAWSLVIFSAVVQILRSYWQGLGAWKRLDLERFGFAILRFVAVLVVAWIGYDSAGPYVAGALAAFVVSGLILFDRSVKTNDRGSSPAAREIYKYSAAAALGSIAVVCSNRIDQALLPIVAPSQELGYYAVAVTVAEVPVVCAALAGRNALTLASKGERLGFILRDIAPFALAGGVLLALLYGGAPLYIPLLFGTDFSASIQAVQFLTIGTAYSFIAFISIALISGRGRPGTSSLIPLMNVIITCAAFVLVGRNMTSLGAAIVSMSAQVGGATLGAFLVFIVYRRPQDDTEATASSLAHVP
ncbi:lipopolysaccharide biosynthesis protein [Arthrobacter sp. UC242_113]|uniref:lipopolysaccharide biosynthesis protein n=1 Tax=Arthrobacter sp. UC242_113 TaxID=3374550 RepID=UPI00375677AF